MPAGSSGFWGLLWDCLEVQTGHPVQELIQVHMVCSEVFSTEVAPVTCKEGTQELEYSRNCELTELQPASVPAKDNRIFLCKAGAQ